MILQEWLDQMEELVNELNIHKPDGRYIENVIGSPPQPEIMREFEHEFHLQHNKLMIEFYSFCGMPTTNAIDTEDCLHLDNVGPGYYLWTVDVHLRTKESSRLMIQGEHTGNIFLIGRNGHEDYIAIRTDEREEILLLPEGIIDNGIYEELDPVQVVASNFSGFLERLLADTQATLRNEEGWKYMTTWEE